MTKKLKKKGEIYRNVEGQIKGQIDILFEKCPERCPISVL
jgi:hypothetical protein